MTYLVVQVIFVPHTAGKNEDSSADGNLTAFTPKILCKSDNSSAVDFRRCLFEKLPFRDSLLDQQPGMGRHGALLQF